MTRMLIVAVVALASVAGAQCIPAPNPSALTVLGVVPVGQESVITYSAQKPNATGAELDLYYDPALIRISAEMPEQADCLGGTSDHSVDTSCIRRIRGMVACLTYEQKSPPTLTLTVTPLQAGAYPVGIQECSPAIDNVSDCASTLGVIVAVDAPRSVVRHSRAYGRHR